MSDWFISGRKIGHSERSGWHTQKEKRKREERKKDRKKKSLSVNLVSGWLRRCCESRCVRGTCRGERWVCFCSQKSLVIPHQPPTMMKISFCVVVFFCWMFLFLFCLFDGFATKKPKNIPGDFDCATLRQICTKGGCEGGQCHGKKTTSWLGDKSQVLWCQNGKNVSPAETIKHTPLL